MLCARYREYYITWTQHIDNVENYPNTEMKCGWEKNRRKIKKYNVCWYDINIIFHPIAKEENARTRKWCKSEILDMTMLSVLLFVLFVAEIKSRQYLKN